MWIPTALIPARLAGDAWSRHLAARLAFSVGAGAVLVGAPGLVSLAAGWTDTHCLLLSMAGWPCPGCGVTTSLIALGTGDVARATRSNPAGVVVASALVAQGIVASRGLWRGGGSALGRPWLERQDRLVLAAIAVAWIARLWSAR